MISEDLVRPFKDDSLRFDDERDGRRFNDFFGGSGHWDSSIVELNEAAIREKCNIPAELDFRIFVLEGKATIFVNRQQHEEYLFEIAPPFKNEGLKYNPKTDREFNACFGMCGAGFAGQDEANIREFNYLPAGLEFRLQVRGDWAEILVRDNELEEYRKAEAKANATPPGKILYNLVVLLIVSAVLGAITGNIFAGIAWCIHAVFGANPSYWTAFLIGLALAGVFNFLAGLKHVGEK